MVTLGAAAGSRGPPPRRPGRSNMDLRQTAVNALSYQLDRAPKLRPPERRQRGSEPGSANVRAVPGPAAGRGWTKRSSGLVDAEPTPSRFPADRGQRPGRERPGRGRVASCDNFLPAQAASRAPLQVRIDGGSTTSVPLKLNRIGSWRVGAQASTTHGDSATTSSRCAGPGYRIGVVAK